MLWKQGDHTQLALSDGIAVDYTQGRFVLVVKDDVWTEYECKALHQNPLHLYFIYERVCALFLLENVDSIDTSDAIFDIHNCDEASQLLKDETYDMEIYLIDGHDVVCGARKIRFDKQGSEIIRKHLQKQMDTPYDDAGFDRALAKIQGTYEPFEMEEMALFKGIF